VSEMTRPMAAAGFEKPREQMAATQRGEKITPPWLRPLYAMPSAAGRGCTNQGETIAFTASALIAPQPEPLSTLATKSCQGAVEVAQPRIPAAGQMWRSELAGHPRDAVAGAHVQGGPGVLVHLDRGAVAEHHRHGDRGRGPFPRRPHRPRGRRCPRMARHTVRSRDVTAPFTTTVRAGVADVTIDHPPSNVFDRRFAAGLAEVLDEAPSVRASLPNKYCDPKIAARLYDEIFDEYRLCDDLGLHIVTNEHHSGINNLWAASPVITGVVARLTKKVLIPSKVG